ncbi:hypothetical protein [Tsukamurella paurometabola]|uniref:Helix-turn-helix DNA binding domain protein n=1 Tax=Tsukamurella paurometabola TaxID=2061 RepID=A0ABS5NET5_TSUPA|nr:hypothetical protein [Tsukamurella paurometabola]MBS4102748.1 hypothetical protein [Tsukamurella paurometabola]
MRIRSIKPDFWRSDDIAALAIPDRLLFIGLWSYVDDNGVGRDRPVHITADLFAEDLSRDSRETLARITDGLANLERAGLIERYQVDGEAYLHVRTWKLHQRVDRPGRSRYPLPGAPNLEFLATPSRESREGVAPGGGEEGSRGAGDEGGGEEGSADAAPTPTPCTRHPNGNPTDEPCHGCRRVRVAAEAAAEAETKAREAAKVEAAARRASCALCDDNGLVETPDGKALRCKHEAAS